MAAQGGLWRMEPPNSKRRPVLIVSRNEAIPVLNNVVLAPLIQHPSVDSDMYPRRTGRRHRPRQCCEFRQHRCRPEIRPTVRLESLGLNSNSRERNCQALCALADCQSGSARPFGGAEGGERHPALCNYRWIPPSFADFVHEVELGTMPRASACHCDVGRLRRGYFARITTSTRRLKRMPSVMGDPSGLCSSTSGRVLPNPTAVN